MRALSIVALLALGGCAPLASAYVKRPASAPLAPPRTVVFLDSGDPKDTKGGLATAAFEFGEYLRNRGFEVKRFPKEDGSTPYGLEVKGVFGGCGMPGGYHFDWIDVYVVDLGKNEHVLLVGGEGYTEGCGMEGGTLFGQLAEKIAAAWAGTAVSGERP